VLLPNLVERAWPEAATKPGQPGASTPVLGGPPITPGGATAQPRPSLAPYPDTVAFRLERVPFALDDIRQSPVIGLGAESFGQRHKDSSQRGAPDHIAILALAALYDAGIIGFVALSVAFGVLLLSLVRTAGRARRRADWRTIGGIAAAIGSVVSLLVSYQATNALHFAINWIVIGAAAALTVREATRDSTSVARA